jgi:hypothetical protein
MAAYPKTNISKSDFLTYLEAPRHLIEEGYAAENLAREYFDTVFLPQTPNTHLFWLMI